MSDLALLSVSELLAGFARKRFSPVEAAQACLARISRLDPVHNAFCLVDAESALRAATQKFRTRFEGVERLATARSIDLHATGDDEASRAEHLAALDALWDEVKRTPPLP